jgi:hypothetical protein
VKMLRLALRRSYSATMKADGDRMCRLRFSVRSSAGNQNPRLRPPRE